MCIHAHVGVCVLAHEYLCGGQRLMLGLFLCCSPPDFFGTGSLTEPGSHHPQCGCLGTLISVLGPWVHTTVPGWDHGCTPLCLAFHVSVGGQNAGSHACTLQTEPSSQPSPLLPITSFVSSLPSVWHGRAGLWCWDSLEETSPLCLATCCF